MDRKLATSSKIDSQIARSSAWKIGWYTGRLTNWIDGIDRIHGIDRIARIDSSRIDRIAADWPIGRLKNNGRIQAVSCAWLLRLFSSWPHSLNRCWACQSLTPEAFSCLAYKCFFVVWYEAKRTQRVSRLVPRLVSRNCQDVHVRPVRHGQFPVDQIPPRRLRGFTRMNLETFGRRPLRWAFVLWPVRWRTKDVVNAMNRHKSTHD